MIKIRMLKITTSGVEIKESDGKMLEEDTKLEVYNMSSEA